MLASVAASSQAGCCVDSLGPLLDGVPGWPLTLITFAWFLVLGLFENVLFEKDKSPEFWELFSKKTHVRLNVFVSKLLTETLHYVIDVFHVFSGE